MSAGTATPGPGPVLPVVVTEVPPWQLSKTLTIENDATLVAASQQRRRAEAEM
ncbi:hypothetical protein [Mycobacterium ahvazicum]|uniref:hypothetical protein n=1 Tax=Mycobacterium ahvazicum TaxID=1964395 RepID=UPI0013FE426F|nr:hypothetical protein [Mycobacterium ahvazicum]